MGEELEESWKKLSLTDKEDVLVGADIEEDQQTKERISLMLVGKVLSSKPFNVEAMRHTLRSIWSLRGGVAIRELESNLFVFQFFNKEDKERVVNGRPWTFDFNLVMLEDLKGEELPSEVQFRLTPMWINVYDASLAKRNCKMAKAIGDHVGKFMEYDESDVLALNRAMRIKVMVDITCPLVRGMKIATGETWKWVKIKYERLPNFCYICGVIGHTQKECDRVEEEGFSVIANQYGPWMRASPMKVKPRISKKEADYEKDWLKKRQLKEEKRKIDQNKKETVATKRNIIFEDQLMNVDDDEAEIRNSTEHTHKESLMQNSNNEEDVGGFKNIDEGSRGLATTHIEPRLSEEGGTPKIGRKMSKFRKIERVRESKIQISEPESLGGSGEKRKTPSEDEEREDPMKIDESKRRKPDEILSRVPFLLQVAEVEKTQPREHP